MTYLWDSNRVDKVLGSVSSSPWVGSGVSIDTRTLQPGDLFVALKGETGDGHTHLQDAAQKGAAAALVSDTAVAPLPLLRVQDTLQALEKMAVAARERSSATRIAVTGSVGKTGTKDTLRTVLGDQGRAHANASSYNNHWGVPLTLARMPKDTKFGIFEMGMNHPGEIRPLSQLVKPDLALITNVAASHVGFFKSEEEIAWAKAEVFEGMEPGQIAVLNRDNPYYGLLFQAASQKELKVYSFGKSESADFRLLSWEGDAEKSKATAEISGQVVPYSLSTPGIHWVMNSLAVLGSAYLVGVPVEKAAQSLGQVLPPSGRGNWYKGPFTVIDESYNANPISMRAAFAVLDKTRGKRKLAVIGDMREMGEFSKKYHEGLLDPLLDHKIDHVFCCGPYMAYLYEHLPEGMKGGYAPTSQELIPQVLGAVEGGDVVSVKGSLGTKMKPIVEALLDLQKTFQKEGS